MHRARNVLEDALCTVGEAGLLISNLTPSKAVASGFKLCASSIDLLRKYNGTYFQRRQIMVVGRPLNAHSHGFSDTFVKLLQKARVAHFRQVF